MHGGCGSYPRNLEGHYLVKPKEGTDVSLQDIEKAVDAFLEFGKDEEKEKI